MVPSGIKRDNKTPFRTRKLDNGTVVIEDAYEGRYTYSNNRGAGTQIKGLRIETPDNKKAAAQEQGISGAGNFRR
ncbi:MAG: hypothetical protein EOR69_32220 [Mesorhizobium sp.]|nr:MAG: hypothetical protein EOR69_32220 [Mesorhizobium sp.]RWL92881.1 MAG: hypothetical protein EOR70_30305 [Mesorhizobium sp.]